MTSATQSTEDQLKVTSPDGTISVLVPLLNEADTVRQTIASLIEQNYEGKIEILLVDGGSTDGTVEIAMQAGMEDPRIRVLHNRAKVTPAALNTGLAVSAGDYIARMDAHTAYPPGYLRSGVERLAQGDVASVSGPQLAEGEGAWARRIAIALGSRLGAGEARFRHPIDEEIVVDSGFTGVWRRSTLMEHGGWDEATYPNEDAELAARIRATGGLIVCIPEMAARYRPRSSLGGLARQYWRYGQYRNRTAVRQPNSLRRSHVLAPGLACALLVAPLGIPLLSLAARCGLALYAVTSTAVSATHIHEHGTDAVTLPAVFATMHFSWGFGFLVGILRFGFPTAAIVRIVSDGSSISNKETKAQ